MTRLLASALLAALLALPATAQEKLTKVEIGKRGKAATAFVEVAKFSTGTAFCVHPSGLFITNEHVVRGATGEVTLVLNPSIQGQRILKAKVIRTDKVLDLALLRVDGEKDLPSLPLGSIKGVAELSEVVACGFPLGFLLSTDRKEYPAISVNAGSVTALRYKDRELEHIQIDVAITFGNSGGPVLDETGKVVGVVVSGISGKNINQAIPVSRLQSFLNKPDIAFVPAELTRATLDKPTEFKAGVVSFVPEAPEATLKLILQTGDENPREFPMKKQGDAWVVSAVPAVKAAARVQVSALIGTSSVTGAADDAVFKIVGKPMRLSAVKRIDFKEKPVVLLADGRTSIEGELVGLGSIEIDLAGQKVKLDLSKATRLSVDATPEVQTVMATVVAIVDKKEVARSEVRMVVREAIATAPVDPSSVKITPPMLDEDKVVKKLPEVFTDAVLGGGGRFLIFHMPKLKKLAIFDISEAKVTKYIALTEEDITYTAGLDCIVIGLKKSGKLERWSLTTFELEKTGAPPFKEDIKMVVMGHASNGPLAANGYLLDLKTFQQLPITNDAKSERIWEAGTQVLASADGTVFGWWNTNYSPSDASTYVLEDATMTRYLVGDMRHVVPGPDGKTMFTGKGIASRTLKRGDPDDANYGYTLPAVRGDFFLSLTTATEGKGGKFEIYLLGLKKSIAKLDNAEHGVTFDGWDRDFNRERRRPGVSYGGGGQSRAPWQQVFFVPEAKAILVLPSSNDRVVYHKIDADAALEKSGENYLLISSKPPREAKAGKTLTYAIKVKSKSGGVTFKLDSGPKGMTVSDDGLVMWEVPADLAAGDQDVILTLRDKSGQDAFHTFAVKVVK